MDAQATTIMDRLKSETRPQHDAAENSDLEKSLLSGAITREAYIELLRQRYAMHLALDPLLAQLRESHPQYAAVIPDYTMQAPYLEEDLRHFGVDPSTVQALPATAGVVERMKRDAAAAPLRLLGAHYVMEGSNNGGRFIAKGLRRLFRLEGDNGVRYFDPYGEEQRPRWAAFREAFNAFPLTPEQQDEVLAGAKQAFDDIAAMDQAVYEAAMRA